MQAIQFMCIPRTPAAAHYTKLNIKYTYTEKLYDLKMVQGRSQALSPLTVGLSLVLLHRLDHCRERFVHCHYTPQDLCRTETPKLLRSKGAPNRK